jgi:adenylate kinase family enzyme
MLIGLVGLIGSGKDTVAEHLVNNYGFKRDSFAKSLKDATANIFGWDRELLEGQTKESREWREQTDEFWSEKFGKPITPRYILQYFGTEVCRGGMLDSVWVDSLIARYKGTNTIISDTRFINEIKTIRKQGGKNYTCKKRRVTHTERNAGKRHTSIRMGLDRTRV